MGSCARILPSAVTVLSSLPWSSMLDWMPRASVLTAGEQAVPAADELPFACGLAAEASPAGAAAGAASEASMVIEAAASRSIRTSVGMAEVRDRERRSARMEVENCILRRG